MGQPDFNPFDFHPLDFNVTNDDVNYGAICGGDFHPFDFDAEDFHTSVFNNLEGYEGITTNFSKFFPNKLPYYFIKNDTYKDLDGKGLLERFLTIFGTEVDLEIIPQIECYLNIIDTSICHEKYLIHLSDVMGNPPDIFLDQVLYRKLLRYIVSVYKIKGTIAAYELFFSLLGFGVVITELPVTNEESSYDNEGSYDTGNPDSIYDQTRCSPCSYYTIDFYPLNNTDGIIDSTTLQKLRLAIFFNEPINAKLLSLTSNFTIEDTLGINISDETSNESASVERYDTDLDYDDSEEYENLFTIGTSVQETPFSIKVITTDYQEPDHYTIKIYMGNDFANSAVDFDNTEFTVKGFGTQGTIIYQSTSNIIGPNTGNNILFGSVGEIPIIASGITTFKINSIIRLVDGRSAVVDMTAGIGNVTQGTIYFI